MNDIRARVTSVVNAECIYKQDFGLAFLFDYIQLRRKNMSNKLTPI